MDNPNAAVLDVWLSGLRYHLSRPVSTTTIYEFLLAIVSEPLNPQELNFCQQTLFRFQSKFRLTRTEQWLPRREQPGSRPADPEQRHYKDRLNQESAVQTLRTAELNYRAAL